MTKDGKSQKGTATAPFEGTRVDLGDDLLEQTRSEHLPELEKQEAAISAPTPEHPAVSDLMDTQDDHWIAGMKDVHSQLESARILINEGLLEQAKKILHRILIHQPDYLAARNALHQIHEEELKQIFSDQRSHRRYRRPIRGDDDPLLIDTDAVLRKLDRELDLGVSPGSTDSGLLREFLDAESKEHFLRNLDDLYLDAALQDRLDIGIGFMEMELHDIAVHLFRSAARKAALSESQSELLPTVCLLATALLLSGNPFEAVLALQPLLNDMEIPRENKLELFYLMARANQSLQKRETAIYWLEQAEKVDPDYRDLPELKRRLLKT